MMMVLVSVAVRLQWEVHTDHRRIATRHQMESTPLSCDHTTNKQLPTTNNASRYQTVLVRRASSSRSRSSRHRKNQFEQPVRMVDELGAFHFPCDRSLQFRVSALLETHAREEVVDEGEEEGLVLIDQLR